MRLSVSWWDLADSEATVESLREYLHDEGVAPWHDVVGLVAKVWFADPERDVWGALMVWQDEPPPAADLPPHVAVDLIGYPPTGRRRLDIEATAEGITTLDGLNGLGLAFATDPQVKEDRT